MRRASDSIFGAKEHHESNVAFASLAVAALLGLASVNTRYRPDLPAWQEDVLLKAGARPTKRYASALWRMVTDGSIVLTLLLIYLLLIR